MNPRYAILILFAMLCSAFPGRSQHTNYSGAAGSLSAPVGIASPSDSPAQARIDAVKRQIAANPKKVQAYNDLATAYVRRARETADAKYYADASEALSEGLHFDAEDFQLQRTQLSVMLGLHEYAQAKERATSLNRRTPDDVLTYGYLAEAEIALGDYSEAEKNAQWMLNMRPNNLPGLMLGARLRALYGDPEGALELLKLAYSETPPTEVEELAWIANRMASVQIDSGKPDGATPLLERAEQLFSPYPYTIENLARVRSAQGRPRDAVVLLLQATQLDRSPQVLYELGQAQRDAGEFAEASATEAEFKKRATDSASQTDEADRNLILLYARDPATASMALTLAQHAIDTRHDVDTLDAYAWALYVNKRYKEADTAIERAIAVGVQDARIFDHAGHIAQILAKQVEATKDFESALRLEPLSGEAADARKALGLSGQSADGKRRDAPAREAPVAGEDTAAKLDSPPSPLTTSAAAPVKASLVVVPITFSPVPKALLTPLPTDTGRLIHNAQAGVERNQKDAPAYAALGAAYFQQARETGDVSDYELAEKSLNLSLDLVSTDFSADDALGTLAEVCMGEHRFADALTYSQRALSLGSGDVSPFAIEGDAYADMGEYDKAGAAYARLTPRDMTLSPRAAYARDSRISYLDFIGGDTAKAIALMKTAVAEGIEAQLPRENLAWLYYELGEYFTQAGDALSANASYLAALQVHPGDYRALAALGKLRANKGRYAEAVVLYQKAIAVVPMPIFIAELGDLYARTGEQAEAKKQYQLVEYIGRLGKINQVLHNRDLALFYADHDSKLPESLELAQKELEVRHDVYTWDALAWALYKNGRFAEAGKASAKALQHGTRDSLLLYHAGLIAEKLGEPSRARAELKQALEINPHFHLIYAGAAEQALALLNTETASSPAPDSHAH